MNFVSCFFKKQFKIMFFGARIFSAEKMLRPRAVALASHLKT